MKIKTPTEFLTFNDGLCDIYNVNSNKISDKVITLCYGNRTIGIKRYYAARAATIEINKLIQIPQQLDITPSNRVVIGNDEFKIEQVQQLNDTNPPVTVLTLRKIGVIS